MSNDHLADLRSFAEKQDAIVLTGMVTLPSGAQLEYVRIIDTDGLTEQTAGFYFEDMKHTLLKELARGTA